MRLIVYLDFDLANTGVKGAYKQSGNIQQDVYMRPPKRLTPHSSTLWKLIRLPYRMVEVMRPWPYAVEISLIETYDASKLISVER